MPPPPPLEELQEEVLLRFPRHEPALLVRAALVCKPWLRLICGPGFRRRFREPHRTPPMLGFVGNIVPSLSGILTDADRPYSCFVPTTAAAFRSPGADLLLCRALDARHGRVLLNCHRRGGGGGVPLPRLQGQGYIVWIAAVLCGRCHHLDCHRGPFLVVYMAYRAPGELIICTYSSDAGTWSDPISTEQPTRHVDMTPSVLVGNALYFGCLASKSLVKYDLESHEMSVDPLPFTYRSWRPVVLDNGLGLATVHESKLCMWKKAGPEVDAGWTENRVIELEALLPSYAFLTPPDVVGFADGIDVIFLMADSVLYTIDTKTYEVKKVFEGKRINCVIPYMSFFIPGTALHGFWFYNNVINEQ
ncbi:uncharacterized protein LOC120659237 [Panicum virgatum]|uniref:uncharacterized protein LOC120659237 n=1 Tax=Panicum virgatum TaxID=38727 RepID=UPI0019D68EF3|nr:uncharacterized protein LOC120659237 [Panicum virgatum]